VRNIDIDEDFEKFLSRVQPRLKRILAFYCVPPENAEGILRDLFLTLLYKRDSIAAPDLWISKTLRHQCILYWRKQRWKLYASLDSAVQGSLSSSAPNTDEKRLILEELDAVVCQLPDSCQDLLRKRYGLREEAGEWLRGEASSPGADLADLEGCLASLGKTFTELGLLGDDTSKVN